MTSERDTDPLSGPIDDEPDEKKTPGGTPDETPDEDGSEWIPEPRPTEGDGPLP
ncbi:hypothetical protein [Frondihabitans peucedani]|uniref:Uncharacterized protein n=1 Tax=Frondihabitans peucedani TaxID=598626 RepID=A0ABP8E5L9_9MICO